MKLVDLEQKVFIPIVDESKGGVTYEVQMSIAEVFAEVFEKFFGGEHASDRGGYPGGVAAAGSNEG